MKKELSSEQLERNKVEGIRLREKTEGVRHKASSYFHYSPFTIDMQHSEQKDERKIPTLSGCNEDDSSTTVG